MPIYEYKCNHCHHEFEMLRFASDNDSDVECPQCREKKAEKLISRTARSGGCGDSCTIGSCGT